MNGFQLNRINISIVLYKTSIEDIDNFLSSLDRVECDYFLYIVDNSPKDDLRKKFLNRANIEYIHNPKNPGFGASHNLAIGKSINNNVPYHFVVNPDAYFTYDVITPMVEYMDNNPKVGMMMPQILNTDGSIQTLPKLLPSPYSVLMRKIKRPNFFYHKFIEQYELRNIAEDKIYNAPILSGCFTLFRTKSLETVGLYDDKFFMYFEDWDLSRRMNKEFDTIYFPKVSVYHGYESGANKNFRLFKIFLNSAKVYFNKWGWIFDRDRVEVNKRTIKELK